ncbi:hypothetical protein LTR56_016799 [Elasticomyces elasticus]|nr:hypothetical protein LTR22_021762 [Elasticomyces elasticus]KAK3631566.1 hypothetical protein LTR56_016799 [Elasticomyces elasticus]KAK4909406.1 hypothetical protein LTR49_021807 [Elasticomyces elasticus]KAK5749346.1 hypothetical protein LTS12_020601 [Elasticomyces elasticus]
MVALELVALALSVLGPIMTQRISARNAAEDSIAQSHETSNAPVLTATLSPAAATTSVQVAVVSSPEIEAVSLLDTSTDCVFQELCDTTTTNISSWRIRFSYGLLASVGSITRPDAAHTALQKMFHQNTAQRPNAPELALHILPEKAFDEASVEPGPMEGSWSSATYSHEVLATIVVVGSRGTKSYANGHILEPTPTTVVITDVSVTQHTSVDDYHVAQDQGFERDQTDSKAEFWLGDIDLLQADVSVTPIDSETRSWLSGTSLWIIAMVFLGFLMTICLWNKSPDDTSNDTHLPAWDTLSIPPMLGTTVDFRPITAPPPDQYGSCEISAAGSTISLARKQVDQYQRYAPAPINYRSGGRALVTPNSLTLEQAHGLAGLQAWNKEGSRRRRERFETDAWNRQAQTAYGDGEMPTQQGTLSQPQGILKNCHTSRPQLQSDMAVAESRHVHWPENGLCQYQSPYRGGVSPISHTILPPAPSAPAHFGYGMAENALSSQPTSQPSPLDAGMVQVLHAMVFSQPLPTGTSVPSCLEVEMTDAPPIGPKSDTADAQRNANPPQNLDADMAYAPPPVQPPAANGQQRPDRRPINQGPPTANGPVTFKLALPQIAKT